MNRVFSLLLTVSLSLVTVKGQAQYSYNTELYSRHRPRNVIQPQLHEATAPVAIPVPAPLPIPVAAPIVPEAPAFGPTSGKGDITVSELFRFQWERIKPKIIEESQHEETAALIQELVDANPCVETLEAYIEFLERRVQMIEEYSPQIEESLLKAVSLRGEKDLGVILSTAADILTNMDVVMGKMIPSFTCVAIADVGVEGLRALALNLYRQSQVRDIPNLITSEVRENFYMAARVVEAASNMIDHFGKNAGQINCYTSTDAFGDFIVMISSTFSDLGEGAGALQYFEVASELRQYAKFILSIKDTVEDLPEFKTKGDCSPGSISRGAAVLKEMANIVSDVDMETLFIETGVSFRLDLLP